MYQNNQPPTRFRITAKACNGLVPSCGWLLLASTLFLSACSGSGSSSGVDESEQSAAAGTLAEQPAENISEQGPDASNSPDTILADDSNEPAGEESASEPGDATDQSAASSETDTQSPQTSPESSVADSGLVSNDDPVVPASTQVTFEVTVPVYVSNALQVRLTWGDREMYAAWVTDESWVVADELLPTNTEFPLSVTFSDDNGAVTLGSFETNFRTGANTSETYRVSANQFDTDRWDDNADGISNLDESATESGTEPSSPTTTFDGVAEELLPVPASVELRAAKTFRIRWEPTTAADYYRVLENPDGVSGYTAITGELDASTDHYDHHVALYKRVNARYMVEACNAGGCTLSVQQLIEGTLDDAIGYFKASNAADRDFLGNSVSLSADGSTMAVGAAAEDSAASGVNGDQSDNSFYDAGAVYLFARNADGWQQQAYIKASNPDAADLFGNSVSLSADGNTLAVGAMKEDSASNEINGDQNDNSDRNAGAVYVFIRSGGQWQQQAYIKAGNSTRVIDECCDDRYGDQFGSIVKLSADGNTLAVAAERESSNQPGVTLPSEDSGIQITGGAVYVFARSGDNWTQHSHIKARASISTSYRNSSSEFGRSLSLSGDGTTLAIGVSDNGTATTTSRSITTRGPDFRDNIYGAVYVYTLTGDSWEKQALLRKISTNRGWYGWSVAISHSGDTLAIAEPDGVDVWERNDGVWQGQTNLETFKGRVALSADGNTLVTSNMFDSNSSTGVNGYRGYEIRSTEAGAAHIFIRRDGVWQEPVFVKASNTSYYNHFGSAIAISADGDTVAIAARTERGASTGINGDQTQPSGGGDCCIGAVYLY